MMIQNTTLATVLGWSFVCGAGRISTPGGRLYSSGSGCGDIAKWVCSLAAFWMVNRGLKGLKFDDDDSLNFLSQK